MDSRILLMLTILIRTIPSLFADNKNYTKCGQLFQCGNLNDIGYPFFGDSRPNYCGHPKFHITNCQSNDSPNIEINSFSYRVISIDTDNHTLKIVRNDYLNTICPQSLLNVTLDGDDNFSYESGTSDLVLYYNCVSGANALPQLNQFPCLSNTSLIEVFYVMSGVGLNEGVTCNTSISVRVESDVSNTINTASFNLSKSVSDGFWVEWTANNSQCEDCVERGGRCGSDPSSESFQCYDLGSYVGLAPSTSALLLKYKQESGNCSSRFPSDEQVSNGLKGNI